MADILKQLNELLQTIVESLGTTWTLLIVVGAFGIWSYLVYRKNKKEEAVIDAYKEVIKEKEKTIQRLANESREQKILIYKKIHKWSDQQIEQYLLKNVQPTPEDTRKSLGDH